MKERGDHKWWTLENDFIQCVEWGQPDSVGYCIGTECPFPGEVTTGNKWGWGTSSQTIEKVLYTLGWEKPWVDNCVVLLYKYKNNVTFKIEVQIENSRMAAVIGAKRLYINQRNENVQVRQHEDYVQCAIDNWSVQETEIINKTARRQGQQGRSIRRT